VDGILRNPWRSRTVSAAFRLAAGLLLLCQFPALFIPRQPATDTAVVDCSTHSCACSPAMARSSCCCSGKSSAPTEGPMLTNGCSTGEPIVLASKTGIKPVAGTSPIPMMALPAAGLREPDASLAAGFALVPDKIPRAL